MNKLILIFVAFSVNFFAVAQEFTNPAAKSYYKSVLSSFEKIRSMSIQQDPKRYESELQKTQDKINLIHQYEPSFDITAIQKTQDELMNKLNSLQAESNASSSNAFQVKKELNFLFKSPSQFYQPSTASVYKESFENYCNSVNSYLTNNGKDRLKQAMETNTRIEQEIFEYNNDDYPKVLADLIVKLSTATDNESPYQNYYLLKHYEKYWEFASTLFERDEYKTYFEATKNGLVQLGSLETILNKKDGNYLTLVSSNRMPQANLMDPTLENLFKKHFTEYSTRMNWNQEVVKINLLTTEWQLIRDKYTNAIVQRYHSAAIATLKNGKYYVYDIVNLYQDYDGKNYTSTFCGHDYFGPEEILKEHIK